MKHFLWFLFLVPLSGGAQIILSTDTIKAPQDLENIQVTRIGGDSLVSTFMIFVKTNVPMHKHAFHSENVIVLEGEAILTLDGITKDIKAGDVIFIPAGTFHEVKVTSELPLKVISVQAPEFDGSDRIPYVKN